MKNKGLANKAAQNRLPGFRVLSQFFLQSISRCAILLYTDHKKHPVFLLRIVSFYRCDPRPSRGLQHENGLLSCSNLCWMRSAPLTGTATPFSIHGGENKSRCDPRPSRGLQLAHQSEQQSFCEDATRAPHGDCNAACLCRYRRGYERMRPAPLTGTATFYVICINSVSIGDAIRAPHGDCNSCIAQA